MLRIISGTAKGTVLETPKGENTRPTLGSTRESISNVLANIGIIESRVLDVFAGTGALGLEALSRGAAKATFIDKNTSAIIKRNAKKCHMETQVEILAGDVFQSLASLEGKAFDYLFIDPPYERDFINKIIEFIFKYRLVSQGAILIVEHTTKEPINLEAISDKCTLWKEKKRGMTLVTYLRCHV